jgi:transcriptional regulator with XRE-family HTH domain
MTNHITSEREVVFIPAQNATYTISFKARQGMNILRISTEEVILILSHGTCRPSPYNEAAVRYYIPKSPLIGSVHKDLPPLVGFFADVVEDNENVVTYIGHDEPFVTSDDETDPEKNAELPPPSALSHMHQKEIAQHKKGAAKVCARKIPYDTLQEADRAESQFRMKFKLDRNYKAYRCPHCGKYHHGHDMFDHIRPGSSFVMKTHDLGEIVATVSGDCDIEGKFPLSLAGTIRLPAKTVMEYSLSDAWNDAISPAKLPSGEQTATVTEVRLSPEEKKIRIEKSLIQRDRIEHAIQESSLPKTKIAKELGISPGALSQKVSGAVRFTLGNLTRLSNVLGVQPLQLLDPTDLQFPRVRDLLSGETSPEPEPPASKHVTPPISHEKSPVEQREHSSSLLNHLQEDHRQMITELAQAEHRSVQQELEFIIQVGIRFQQWEIQRRSEFFQLEGHDGE